MAGNPPSSNSRVGLGCRREERHRPRSGPTSGVPGQRRRSDGGVIGHVNDEMNVGVTEREAEGLDLPTQVCVLTEPESRS